MSGLSRPLFVFDFFHITDGGWWCLPRWPIGKRRRYSVDGEDFANLGDSILEIPFDAGLEREVAGRATHAGPVKTDADGPIVRDFDEFDITAVGPEGRSNEVDYMFDPVIQSKFGCIAHFMNIIARWHHYEGGSIEDFNQPNVFCVF